MTKSIVLAGLLLGSTAFACPNLSGTYVCADHGETYEQTVSQAEAAGVTTYSVTVENYTDVLVADGKPYTSVEKDSDYTYTTSTTSSCSADVLNVEFKFEVADQAGTNVSEGNGNLVVSLDASGNLQSVVSSQGQSETTVCTRK